MADQSHLTRSLSTPDITIVVPAFGAAKTLADTVASALTGHDINVEVIVVDDAALDESAAIADQCAHDDRVTVVHRTITGGPSAARNEGLRRARGEFILFLDADDQLLPGGLTALRASIDEGVAAMGRFVAVDEVDAPLDIGTWADVQLRPVVRRGGQFVESERGFTAESILTRLVTPPPGAILIRKSAALAVGGYDVSAHRSEDIDFLVRLSSVGTLVAVPDAVLRYRRRATQRSANARRRRTGRQRTLLALVWHATSRQEAVRRSRGIASHHIDRAETRWTFGDHQPRDAAVAIRSYGLAAGFRSLGLVVALVRRTA